MNGRKNVIFPGILLSACLIASGLTAVLMADFYQHSQFVMLETVCERIIEEQPEAEQAVFTALKSVQKYSSSETGKAILSASGYHPADFLHPSQKLPVRFAVIGFVFGGILISFLLWYLHKKEGLRIRTLTDYLEAVNTGGTGLLLQSGEDEFSRLQDEIYKTVTMLYQTRESAIKAKNNFAENLSGIAHQMKTPITSISLSAQMLKEYSCGDYPGQILKQLSKLTHLEESLLILARIDAGTLELQKKNVDVFTVLTLAADHLQELFFQKNVTVIIPELGETEIVADLDWTMEAVMNLMKNCMEHTPSGRAVHCSYEKNPLYTEILIWDEGEGFAKEDIPHLFQRFYRGRNAKENGIGIGLSLAKELIEGQNGTIRAGYAPDGGACFEVRFYCH